MNEFLGPLLSALTRSPAWVGDVVRLTFWLALLSLVFMPLERLFGVRQGESRPLKLLDIGYYFLNNMFPALVLAFPVALMGKAGMALMPDAWLHWVSHLPTVPRLFLALLVGEIGYYWGHRWSHTNAFLWRFHSIHHSAKQVDYLVNTRAHPLDVVFTRLCGLLPMTVLGFAGPNMAGTATPLAVSLFGIVWSFFIHANVRWRFGPLEWLISTPAFHHWHHTLDEPINRNYASTFPWLDKLFGSFYLPKEWPKAYGVHAPVPENLLDQLLDPVLPKAFPPALAASLTEPAAPAPGGNSTAASSPQADLAN